jgi:hypothetical protein
MATVSYGWPAIQAASMAFRSRLEGLGRYMAPILARSLSFSPFLDTTTS